MTPALLPLHLLPEPALLVDAGGGSTAANPAACRLFRNDLAGRELSAFIPDPTRFWSAIEAYAVARALV